MFADAAPVIEAVFVQVEPDVHLRLVESPSGLFVDHAVQTIGTEEILTGRVDPYVILRQGERSSYYRVQSLADAYILEGELTFTQAPASADITSEVVAMLDKMKITLPPLPRQLDPQTGQPAK